MLHQLPPNAPMAPPGEEALWSGQKRRWLWLMGGLSIFGVVFLLMTPLVITSWKDVVFVKAISNARQIGFSLFEFHQKFGSLPGAETITKVQEKTGTPLALSGASSNDLFRQLIATDMVGGEACFYAKVPGSRKPDGRIGEGQALEKGECGYAYISGLSTKGNPARPIVVTPLIPGTDRFDPKPFKGKAVILRIDNSVTSMPIQADGSVRVNGMNILDAANPIWGGIAPVIAWPDL